jgi:hypothetical protein
VDAFGFFDPIVKSGDAVYDCIGVTDGGKWIWITARMRQVNEIAVRDPIAGFILLAYKHGTTGPPGAASSGKAPTIGCKPVRIICKTVLNDGLLYPLLRVRVTQSGTTTLEGSPTAATKKIAIHFHSLADIFRAMLGIEMGENRLRSYLEAVFPKARASGRGNKYRDPTDRDRAIKQCIRLFVEGKGNDLPGARSTLWAAYSAVSEYVDYYETRFDDPARLHGIWGCPLKSYAMAKATELVRAL